MPAERLMPSNILNALIKRQKQSIVKNKEKPFKEIGKELVKINLWIKIELSKIEYKKVKRIIKINFFIGEIPNLSSYKPIKKNKPDMIKNIINWKLFKKKTLLTKLIMPK